MRLIGPFREPAQMLAAQSYGGHKSVHDAGSAALYPFTLRQKRATITEHLSFQATDALTPWDAPVMPFEMLSVLTNAFSKDAGFVARQPSVGLFIDLEVRIINGPVLVGHRYGIERELVALGQSKRTESFWTRTTLLNGDQPVAEVLLHQGVFKASYAGYPDNASAQRSSVASTIDNRR